MPASLAYRQHSNVRAGALMVVPGFDTPATRFLQSVAKQLDQHEWAYFNVALYWVLMLAAGCLRRDGNGIRLPDRAQHGHVFLIFANADGEGCVCGGNVEINEIDAAREDTVWTTARERRARLSELTKTARAQRLRMGDATSRALAVECAGLLADPAEIEAFRDVEEALPVYVILTRREFGRSLVRWRTVSTTLPGEWLGTSAPAGHA